MKLDRQIVGMDIRKSPCQICVRENVEVNNETFYGLMGDYTCKKCGRKICWLHSSERTGERLCYDCGGEYEKKDKV